MLFLFLYSGGQQRLTAQNCPDVPTDREIEE